MLLSPTVAIVGERVDGGSILQTRESLRFVTKQWPTTAGAKLLAFFVYSLFSKPKKYRHLLDTSTPARPEVICSTHEKKCTPPGAHTRSSGGTRLLIRR